MSHGFTSKKGQDMPLGLAMKFGMFPEAMNTFSNLPSEDQNKIINYVQNSKTGDETHARIDEVMQKLDQHDTAFYF